MNSASIIFFERKVRGNCLESQEDRNEYWQFQNSEHVEQFIDFNEHTTDWEDFCESDDCCLVTARAVTGSDGQYLCDEIDLSNDSSIDTRLEKDPYKSQKLFEKPQKKPLSPWVAEEDPPRAPQKAPRELLEAKPGVRTMVIKKLRNKHTGQVYDWLPIFTLDDHLEVIESIVYVYPTNQSENSGSSPSNASRKSNSS